MRKIHFIVLLLFGIFLMPTNAFACGNHSSQSSCSMEMSSKTKNKDCCTSKNNKQKSCSGKCGQALCSANSVVNSVLNTNETLESEVALFNFDAKKTNFSNSISFPSDGYSTIWLIPKIG